MIDSFSFVGLFEGYFYGKEINDIYLRLSKSRISHKGSWSIMCSCAAWTRARPKKFLCFLFVMSTILLKHGIYRFMVVYQSYLTMKCIYPWKTWNESDTASINVYWKTLECLQNKTTGRIDIMRGRINRNAFWQVSGCCGANSHLR